jgi:hypothetical protein
VYGKVNKRGKKLKEKKNIKRKIIKSDGYSPLFAF